MFVKTYVLAALAGLAQALPSPAPVAEAESLNHLQARADTPNGAILLYSGTGYSTPSGSPSPLVITPYKGQDAYCTYFAPIRKGGVSFRSYLSASILFIGYGSSDCSGNGYVIVSAMSRKRPRRNVLTLPFRPSRTATPTALTPTWDRSSPSRLSISRTKLLRGT